MWIHHLSCDLLPLLPTPYYPNLNNWNHLPPKCPTHNLGATLDSLFSPPSLLGLKSFAFPNAPRGITLPSAQSHESSLARLSNLISPCTLPQTWNSIHIEQLAFSTHAVLSQAKPLCLCTHCFLCLECPPFSLLFTRPAKVYTQDLIQTPLSLWSFPGLPFGQF